MTLKDRTTRKVVTHRIACGRPGNPNGHGRDKSPSRLDYFEITGVEQDPATGQFAVETEAMKNLASFGPRYATNNGDKDNPQPRPRRIPIRVASDDIDEFMPQAYRSRTMLPVVNSDGTPKMVLRKGGSEPVQLTRLQPWCEGDGATAKRLYGGERISIPCRCSPKNERPLDDLQQLLTKRAKHDPVADERRCPWAQNASLASTPDAPAWAKASPVCKPETVLICTCDALGSIGSFARFRSHGHYTADAMVASLEEIKSHIGVLAGVPLDLVLMMKRINVPGSSMSGMQAIVHVELRMSVDDTVRLLAANLQSRLSIMEQRKTLQLARTEAEDIDAEFTPLLTGREGGGGLST